MTPAEKAAFCGGFRHQPAAARESSPLSPRPGRVPGSLNLPSSRPSGASRGEVACLPAASAHINIQTTHLPGKEASTKSVAVFVPRRGDNA